MSDLRVLFDAVRRDDVATVAALTVPSVVVQCQRRGHRAGRQEVAAWVHDTAAWLERLQARATQVAQLETAERVVLELSMDIEVDGETVDLPFVLVGDRTSDGLAELRTYHSTWPYTGSHVVRPSPLEGRVAEEAPEIFRWYIDRVHAADVQAVLGRFTPDGYVREPSGERFRHQGPDQRAAFYGHLVHAPRATFDLMTSTVQGDTIAVEYAFAYGDVEKVGGICIMEVAADRIAAVRITDDVGV